MKILFGFVIVMLLIPLLTLHKDIQQLWMTWYNGPEIKHELHIQQSHNRELTEERIAGLADMLLNDTDTHFSLGLMKNLSMKSVELFGQTSDILFLTFGNDEHLTVNRKSVLNNIMYSIRNQVPFILDQNETMPIPNNDAHFHKIASIIRAFQQYPRCNKLIWIDTDLALTDEQDIFMHQVVRPSWEGKDLILADHSDNLNNGIFILRRSEWSMQFLQDWLKLSHLHNGLFAFQDQGAIYGVIMRYIQLNHIPIYYKGKKSPPPICQDFVTECEANDDIRNNSIHNCMNSILDCYGLTYNNRINMGKIMVLPQNKPEYRFNQWWFGNNVRPYGSSWLEESYYAPGKDIGCHSKFLSLILTKKHYVAEIRRIFDMNILPSL